MHVLSRVKLEIIHNTLKPLKTLNTTRKYLLSKYSGYQKYYWKINQRL